MKVRIKTWKRMSAEYGYALNGSINCKNTFIHKMEIELPSNRIIEVVDGAWEGSSAYWMISDDMIAEQLDDKIKENVHDIIKKNVIQYTTEDRGINVSNVHIHAITTTVDAQTNKDGFIVFCDIVHGNGFITQAIAYCNESYKVKFLTIGA